MTIYPPQGHIDADLEDQIEIIIDVKDTEPLFNKIGSCESNDNPLAKNPNSSAKGRFQFIDSTWEGYAPMLWGDDWVNKDVLDYNDNTELAWFVYTNYGTADWEVDPLSYDCWKSHIHLATHRNIY